MKFSSFIVAVIPFMLSCSNTQAANLNSAITWFEFDSPPYYIVKGTLKNQGLAQIFRRELETLLPHYNHQVRQGNFVRGLGEIEKRDNVCATSLLKTKAYEKFAYFSEPWIMVMANGLNVRTNDLNQYKAFISDGTLDLHALLTQSDFVLGKLNARPYGVTIDKIINDFEDNSRLFNLTGSSKMHDLLHLFTKRKQVDGVLGYAAEIQYYANEYQMAADAITYLPIKNNKRYYKAYVGCSKSPLGKSIITRINQEIITKRDTIYQARYLSFLTPASQKIFNKIENKSF